MKQPGLTRLALNIAPLLALLVQTGVASADEPRKVNEPTVLNEPAEITDVVDAFDDEDPFDLHLSLGFQQTWTRGNIRRETNDAGPQFSSGGFTADNVDVAHYVENTSRLNTKAEVGIFKDIALIARLPIILSNTRKLESPSGGADATATDAAPGEPPLFRVPFEAPKRSGIEYLAIGLDFGIFNQARDYTKPTWMLGFEGRFNVAEPLHACDADANLQCAYPSDVNRNGVADGSLEGNKSGERDPGVSRGTTGLEVHTYISKRVKYVEPYGGFSALFEFQNESSDYGRTDFKGSLVNHPPFRGSMVGGITVIPWEIRDQFQRLMIDFRLKGTYITEGRDYSPLFDALGSTTAPSMRRPNFSTYMAGPGGVSVVDPNSEKVYFTGITDVQQHGQYTISTQLTFQAGEYVKFNVGGGYTLEQGHVLNMDQPCNPDFKNDATKSGPCRSNVTAANFDVTGIPNPNYRPPINTPGRRYRYDDGTAFDAWLNATVMF